MSEGDALLAAVCDEPEDDAPRLVYADWLEDNGDSKRAEFIRGQIELLRMSEDDPRLEELSARLKALEKANGSRWRKERPARMNLPYPSVAGRLLGRPEHLPPSQFHRGFLAAVKCQAGGWPRQAARAFERLPLQAVEFTRLTGLALLARDPYLERLTAVRLDLERPADAAVLASATWLPSLRVFLLQRSQIDAGGIRALFGNRELPRLRRLSLAASPLGPEAAVQLAGARLPALNWLELPETEISEAGAAALASSPVLTSLSHLDLRESGLGNTGTIALAGSSHLGSLEVLNLSHNAIGSDGGIALGQAPFLPRLLHLDLSWGRLGETGVIGFTGFASTGRLRHLRLWSCAVGDTGAEHLANWPALANLRSLDLSDNGISGAGAIALATSPWFGNLTTLDLGINTIDNEGVRALARSPYLARLRSLKLESNEFGDVGLLALANSPLAASLQELRLYVNEFTAATRRLLRERMGDRVTF